MTSCGEDGIRLTSVSAEIAVNKLHNVKSDGCLENSRKRNLLVLRSTLNLDGRSNSCLSILKKRRRTSF